MRRHLQSRSSGSVCQGFRTPYVRFVAGFDVVIDFTTPEAAVQNMRACLATGARMVVGTTGWYAKLADMRSLTERRQAGLLYGTNFSVGVQVSSSPTVKEPLKVQEFAHPRAVRSDGH